ncbi:MAG TPA: hypothetical protein VGW96_04950 [Candidatus Eremiobacteraceae bacterium]|jgi:hypothetical protein|nr:hypothetical protein [Candidatus Eremiobacteraceae bacterium]
MIRLIILAVIAYFAWRYYGWYGAAGVVGAYVVLVVTLGMINANRTRSGAQRLIGQKLSEAEKAHLSATHEHHQVMHDRMAQFNPELRRPRE